MESSRSLQGVQNGIKEEFRLYHVNVSDLNPKHHRKAAFKGCLARKHTFQRRQGACCERLEWVGSAVGGGRRATLLATARCKYCESSRSIFGAPSARFGARSGPRRCQRRARGSAGRARWRSRSYVSARPPRPFECVLSSPRIECESRPAARERTYLSAIPRRVAAATLPR